MHNTEFAMGWEEENDGDPIEWDCRFSVEPFTPECRRGHPDNWTPAEGGGATLELMMATIDGSKVVLSAFEAEQRFGANLIEEIEDMAAESISFNVDDDGPDPDDERDRQIDREMDDY